MQTIFNFRTNEIIKTNDMVIIIQNKVKIRIILNNKDYKL